MLIQLVLAAVFIAIEPHRRHRRRGGRAGSRFAASRWRAAVRRSAMRSCTAAGLRRAGTVVACCRDCSAVRNSVDAAHARLRCRGAGRASSALGSHLPGRALAEPPAEPLAPAVAGVLRPARERRASYLELGLAYVPSRCWPPLRLQAVARARAPCDDGRPLRAGGNGTAAAGAGARLSARDAVRSFDSLCVRSGAVLARDCASWQPSVSARAERENRHRHGDAGNGRLCSGVDRSLRFALVAMLIAGYLTVAFALAAFGTACVATLRRYPAAALRGGCARAHRAGPHHAGIPAHHGSRRRPHADLQLAAAWLWRAGAWPSAGVGSVAEDASARIWPCALIG